MAYYFQQFFKNQVFFITFYAWLTAQGVKIFLDVIREKRFNFKWLLATGGMPSSHAAAVSALAACIGFVFGFNTPMFALTLLFALVTMFDAQGVRRAVGKQAEILNDIAEDIYYKRPIRPERLAELLGHTPLEVIIGAFIGILIAIIFYGG